MHPSSKYHHRFACLLAVTSFLLVFICADPAAIAGPAPVDTEYTGKLDAELIPSREDLDQVVLKPFNDFSKIKFATPLESGVTVTAGRLFHPPQDKSVIITLLVEPEDDSEPYLYADLNLDNVMQDNERFPLRKGEEDNPYMLEATLKVPMKSTLFQSYPVFVQYLKGVKWDELSEGERIIFQSKEAFAKGSVDIGGRKTLVQYSFNPQTKKISVTNGTFGVDSDGDGKIVVDRFSPESADAREETVVFRVGDTYVSTRRVDMEKNQIIMRAHPASDYKRIEVQVGSELPDFQFTDFGNKKHKLSEFRGKYVLLDFWAAWCPPCRRELPYQKAAYSRYQARGFEILGMNNDDDPSMIRDSLKKNGLVWPQATLESIKDVEIRYRIHLFPTSLLIGPDGKVLLVDQHKMRGQDLLKTLDKILPL
ncbi:MAG TPA: redoxin domain-containing protein [Pyrinomonadaceae bacterium]|jgi:thiol-disulfide isomerase/thioredoxin|nr:redoxin domain-containing protein [Pyrinomonadaceae bacterium]